MEKLLLVDGNSIANRAFYGIMGSKMLTASDGTYTNAVYGFLAILFKILEDEKPEYIAVAFDLKGPTKRHEMYEGYKANRKGMPEELAMQMPIIKEILVKMNIKIVEKVGYEGDDIIGTLAKRGEKKGLHVVILSGDRDTFQLASDNITVHIPRTKMGKTEVDDFDRQKVLETYGIEPKQLIDLKGLMGDSSDNIPGVPGVGEKTALPFIKNYGSIESLYNELEKGNAPEIKGKTREKLLENKELALLSKELGTININAPLEELVDENLEQLHKQEWDKQAVYDKFKELRFNRYIERFNLSEGINSEQNENIDKEKYDFELKRLKEETEIQEVLKKIKENKKLIYILEKSEDQNQNKIIKKQIKAISIVIDKIVYNIQTSNENLDNIKQIFEDDSIKKVGYHLSEDYVLLMQKGIQMKQIYFDTKIAAYLLNPTDNKYLIENLMQEYLQMDQEEYFEKIGLNTQNENKQLNLFDAIQDERAEQKEDIQAHSQALKVWAISKLEDILTDKMEEQEELKLFQNIEMPLVEILAQMQYVGMHVDKQELIEFGKDLKEQLEILTKQIYELAGEEFNINSTQQLGVILFEKLNLTYSKKNKKGYSTDVDALEKIRDEHPIVEKILEYRTLTKLNSTYVEGLIPYINENTKRIHSYFHQTVTATGRISSSDPNLQNIPTRYDFGKQLRKVFKPEEGYIYIDADYSQIELRVLAHISQDEHMLEAFKNGEDIHKQAASKVLGIPIEEVTKEQRSSAKAVNFGIVYGISDFGLAGQLGTSRKEAKKYIDQYLEKYSGIKEFMSTEVEKAKENGYTQTLFQRRRYIPELKSSNYMVRQFGSRAAMNTPIQGTAADIMKIAMINTYNKLQQEKLDAKIVLQVHDELILEVKEEQKEQAKQLLKECMESATTLSVPLEVEVSEAKNWYEAK